MMKTVFLLLIFYSFFPMKAFSLPKEGVNEIIRDSNKTEFKNAAISFSEGKYFTTLEELKAFETQSVRPGKELQGLISYWKGICFNRIQEFEEAIKSFEHALSLEYIPADIHYEYGQALFASEKLIEARLQFKESLKRKYKRAVSLYYLGYISKELGEMNKAYTFFKAIQKLPEEDRRDVLQAAEMQIGDMYLAEAQYQKKGFMEIERIVIPQYKKTLEIDPDSELGPLIQDKIISLQKKYDLLLFQFRNGRPTQVPPYFLRFAQEFGNDTNVLFSPAETTISKSRQQSTYSKSEIFGRYSFYIDDFISLSPEFRATNYYYFNRVPEVYRNDNYLLAPALRTSIEHSHKKRPASFLMDYEYNESRRDVNAQKELEFSSRSHSFLIGERLTLLSGGESTFRYRYRILDSYLSSSDSTLSSFIFEDIRNFYSTTLLLFLGHDRMRVENNFFDTNSWTFRSDFIFSRFRDWFTPSFGIGLTITDPINNRKSRGQETLFNPNIRLSKFFKKNWRTTLKADYYKNQSKDEENFAFQKSTLALEIEYFF